MLNAIKRFGDYTTHGLRASLAFGVQKMEQAKLSAIILRRINQNTWTQPMIARPLTERRAVRKSKWILLQIKANSMRKIYAER